MQQYRLADMLESSSPQRDPMDNRLNTSQHRGTPVAQASPTLGCGSKSMASRSV